MASTPRNGTKKSPKTGKKKGDGGAWIAHVKAYRAAHPGMSYKDAMIRSRTSYSKKR